MTGVIWQDQEEQAYFAVFDGHGGVDAAIYAANHLHVNLVRQESFSHDPSDALCRAFKVTDEGFVKKARREVDISHSLMGPSTSTAFVPNASPAPALRHNGCGDLPAGSDAVRRLAGRLPGHPGPEGAGCGADEATQAGQRGDVLRGF